MGDGDGTREGDGQDEKRVKWLRSGIATVPHTRDPSLCEGHPKQTPTVSRSGSDCRVMSYRCWVLGSAIF